jgi:hypothetical protein
LIDGLESSNQLGGFGGAGDPVSRSFASGKPEAMTGIDVDPAAELHVSGVQLRLSPSLPGDITTDSER